MVLILIKKYNSELINSYSITLKTILFNKTSSFVCHSIDVQALYSIWEEEGRKIATTNQGLVSIA